MSNLGILEDINKHKQLNKFETRHINNINDDDLYVCKIERKNRNHEYVYLSKNGYDEIQKKEGEDELFIPLLNKKLQKHNLYCAGKAGQGKSVFVGDMTRQYHLLYPSNKIYYICSKPIGKDETFSKMTQYVKQIDINVFQNKSKEQILDLLKNSLIVMDDNDDLPQEEKKLLNFLQKTILFLGRSYYISLFKISHYKTDGFNTREIITELDYYVTFINRDIENDRMLKVYKKIKKQTYDDLDGSIWAFFDFGLDIAITNKKVFFLE